MYQSAIDGQVVLQLAGPKQSIRRFGVGQDMEMDFVVPTNLFVHLDEAAQESAVQVVAGIKHHHEVLRRILDSRRWPSRWAKT